MHELGGGALGQEKPNATRLGIPEHLLRAAGKVILQMPYECNRVDDAIGQSRHSFRSFFKSSSKPLMSILPFRSPRRLERACLMRIPDRKSTRLNSSH